MGKKQLILYHFNINFKKITMIRNKVNKDSTIGKILLGKTRGFHDWYVKKILDNRWKYEVIN